MFATTKKAPVRNSGSTKPNGPDQLLKKLADIPATVDLAIAGSLALYSAVAIFVDHAKFVGLLCLLFALIFAGMGINSVIKDMGRMKFLERISSVEHLKDLDRYEAIGVITAIYELNGYSVHAADDSDRKQNDIDLVASKGKKAKVLIRCRDWEGQPVSLETVKAVKAAVTGLAASSATIFTTIGFAAEAQAFGTSKNLELLDGFGILAKIAEVTTGTSASPSSLPAREGEPSDPDGLIVQATIGDTGLPKKILFVDVDAVCQGADILAQVLAKHNDYHLVASTYQDEGIKRLYAALPTLSAVTIDKTPDLTGVPGRSRYMEIQKYLRESAAKGAKWAAIDTYPQQFPEATVEMIAVNKERGFTHGAAERLAGVL